MGGFNEKMFPSFFLSFSIQIVYVCVCLKWSISFLPLFYFLLLHLNAFVIIIIIPFSIHSLTRCVSIYGKRKETKGGIYDLSLSRISTQSHFLRTSGLQKIHTHHYITPYKLKSYREHKEGP